MKGKIYAFPLPVPASSEMGMELRDWFAGMAMSGLALTNISSVPHATLARLAYEIADEMMKVRKNDGELP